MNYQLGTVAVATVRGVPNVRVFMADPDSPMEWTSAGPIGSDPCLWHRDRDVTDVRPLVVLDLGDSKFAAKMMIETLSIAQARISGSIVDLHRKRSDIARLQALIDQIERQTKPPAPRFPLGARVRFNGEITSDDVWAKRRDERHVGIVVDHFGPGDVRVYDTVEHDWWQCDEGRLAAVEDES